LNQNRKNLRASLDEMDKALGQKKLTEYKRAQGEMKQRAMQKQRQMQGMAQKKQQQNMMQQKAQQKAQAQQRLIQMLQKNPDFQRMSPQQKQQTIQEMIMRTENAKKYNF